MTEIAVSVVLIIELLFVSVVQNKLDFLSAPLWWIFAFRSVSGQIWSWDSRNSPEESAATAVGDGFGTPSSFPPDTEQDLNRQK